MNENKIGIIGAGRLGICFALLLEKAGYNIIASDINKEYVEQLNNKQINTHEPDVSELLKKSVNINFTTDNKEVLKKCKFIYVMVATPSLSDGSYDTTSIEQILYMIYNILI
jgi:UDP-glucose 6-dehydrogenase